MNNNSTTLIYVLGSISIICCCFFGLGIVLALPAFLIANKKVSHLTTNDIASFEDIKSMNNAKTFALITLIINALYLLYSIYSFYTTDWNIFMEEYQKALERYQ